MQQERLERKFDTVFGDGCVVVITCFVCVCMKECLQNSPFVNNPCEIIAINERNQQTEYNKNESH